MKHLFASNNLDKQRELRAITSHPFLTPADLNLSLDPDETGTTFTANAVLKALAFHRLTGLPSWADDSGMCVDALDGAPGVWSARWSGGHGNHEANNARLRVELQARHLTSSPAHYVTCIAIVGMNTDLPVLTTRDWTPDLSYIPYHNVIDGYSCIIVEKCLSGVVNIQSTGVDGFAYDPHFYVNGRSIASLTPAEKAAISPRGKALRFATKLAGLPV
jgi:XTP/dITP diphosphohydrolase